MSSQSPSFPRNSRGPKPGLGFTLVRAIGWTLQITGWLFIGAAVIGFLIMLVKVGPDLIGSFEQTSEGKFAGFVFLILLTYLLIFPLLGLVGALLAGIGWLFGRWGTHRVASETGIGPISSHSIQVQKQDPG